MKQSLDPLDGQFPHTDPKQPATRTRHAGQKVSFTLIISKSHLIILRLFYGLLSTRSVDVQHKITWSSSHSPDLGNTTHELLAERLKLACPREIVAPL